MGNTTEKSFKMSDWWKSVKAQFKRIIWPTPDDIARQSAAVIIISVILGAVIALLDKGLLQVVDMIISI